MQELQRQQSQQRALAEEMQRQQQEHERAQVRQEERLAREKRQRQQREQLVHPQPTTAPGPGQAPESHRQTGPTMPGAGPLLPTMGGPIRPAPMPLQCHPAVMPSDDAQLLGGGTGGQLQGSPAPAWKQQWQALPKTVVNGVPGVGVQISPHAVLSGGGR